MIRSAIPAPLARSLCAAVLLALAACGGADDGGPGSGAEIAQVVVTPNPATVEVGATVTLSAQARDAEGDPIPGVELTWSTSAEATATVDENGVVSGVAAGTATITATAGEVSGSATVEVTAPTEPPVSGRLVAVGGDFSCALDPATDAAAGRLACWGKNQYGQFGNGGTAAASLPVEVAGAPSFASIATGQWYGCGLTADGTAYCAGFGGSGNLGTGDATNTTVFTPVSTGAKFTRLATAWEHTCGVTTAGQVLCWGASNLVGDGTSQWRLTPTPIDAPTGVAFTQVAATGGAGNTCALATTGEAWCWGSNSIGQTGTGPDNSQTAIKLSPVQVRGGHTFTTIATAENTTCGITTAGETWCWGGSGPTVGIGPTMPHTCTLPQAPGHPEPCVYEPVKVPTTQTFVAIEAGYDHFCALNPQGEAFCWGLNLWGQLGTGDKNVRDTPTAVQGGLTFARISAGHAGTCGIATDGKLYCWGSNADHKLGLDAGVTEALTPTEVPLP
ncbi:MAG TPA: Ig-like domain-containing protein [Gemmatimonadales bacterium]|nr:Ig-like domain-containing protein [Gemmatimonadales bacterium]